MTIALLHAYRAANRGDARLVDLSRRLVREATGTEPLILALDPQGLGPGARSVLSSPARLRAGGAAVLSGNAVTARLGRSLLDLPRPCDLSAAIGIGGGYLRATTPTTELAVRGHHLPQLRLVATMGRRGAYLPLSVGPFRRGLGRTVRRLLAAPAWVATRDDRSTRYLAGWANTWRLPDLAACRLGVDRPRHRPGDADIIGVILRYLPGSDLGFAAVSMLENRGFKARFGVQSTAGPSDDDRPFYRARGVLDGAEDVGLLLDDVEHRPSVIMAGRLHAALDAIAAGIPTVHLGYGRKSVGTFDDLGLGDWVFDAWTAHPAHVADAVEALAADPGPYWDRLSGRFDHLAASWDRLGASIEALAALPGRRR
ncbi:MAG: polysaccharide pyruvyl transferase family protein [Acidimicrobiales bacterium]